MNATETWFASINAAKKESIAKQLIAMSEESLCQRQGAEDYARNHCHERIAERKGQISLIKNEDMCIFVWWSNVSKGLGTVVDIDHNRKVIQTLPNYRHAHWECDFSKYQVVIPNLGYYHVRGALDRAPPDVMPQEAVTLRSAYLAASHSGPMPIRDHACVICQVAGAHGHPHGGPTRPEVFQCTNCLLYMHAECSAVQWTMSDFAIGDPPTSHPFHCFMCFWKFVR